MRGHVRKRGMGWVYVVDLPRYADGKRRPFWSKGFASKKQAEAAMNVVLADLNKGTYVEPSSMLVGDYLQLWLDDYAKHNCAEKTAERYEELIRNQIIPALGSHKLSELKPLHIQGFYSKAIKDGRVDGKGGLSPRTVQHIHRLLNNALNSAVKLQILANNPAQAAKPPRVQPKEMTALTSEQSLEMLDLLNGNELRIPVLVALMTGLRRGELLGLKWEDVDWEQGRMSIKRALKQSRAGLTLAKPKTERSSRTISLPQVALDVLGSHRASQAQHKLALGSAYKNNGLIFASPDGSPLSPDTLSSRFAAFIRRHPILPKLRFHDLRHTHASLLLQQSEHAKVVCERLGHSSVAFTLDTYGHLMPGMQEGAASKLDVMFPVSERKKNT